MINHIFKKRFLLLFLHPLLFSCEKPKEEIKSWRLESTEEIGGYSTTIWGNPEIILGEKGKVVEFNGRNDGFLVDHNPLTGMEEFTIIVELKPYEGYLENKEQRFLHIQDSDNDERRILLELRLNNRNEWYGDWFIKNENQSLTLIDSTLTHPVDEWATISMEYKDGQVTGYVNGKHEVAGNIEYLPVSSKGKVSIGTRMDKRSWFKGAIRRVTFIPDVKL